MPACTAREDHRKSVRSDGWRRRAPGPKLWREVPNIRASRVARRLHEDTAAGPHRRLMVLSASALATPSGGTEASTYEGKIACLSIQSSTINCV